MFLLYDKDGDVFVFLSALEVIDKDNTNETQEDRQEEIGLLCLLKGFG